MVVAPFGITPPAPDTAADEPLMFSVDDLDPFAQSGYAQPTVFNGEKFYGGFGETKLFELDYWELRAKSAQLFTENLYARGLIRRLVTNEINTGLTPEASPFESVLGLPEDSLSEWTEDVETRFGLWGSSPTVCDWHGERTFGGLQRAGRLEALVAGDVLVVCLPDPKTNAPKIRLVRGDRVRSPYGSAEKLRKGHYITEGVEFDANGRVAAHWIQQDDLSFQRLPAYGPRTGRRISWLWYGVERRLDGVRGTPLLSLVLQCLKEVDRYRDSAVRKAVVSSVISLFIKRSSDKPSMLPMQGGAARRGTATVQDNASSKQLEVLDYLPGTMLTRLADGEEVVFPGGAGTDTNFGLFEEAIMQTVAWANEVPPEILRLAFSNNYSASAAAINEFKIYLNKVWAETGEQFCAPIYQEWLIASVLAGRVRADGFVQAWRNPARFEEFGAWLAADWCGSIKPSTDAYKQARGSKAMLEEGWTTNARESRVLTGTKFSQNMKRIARENVLKAAAARPLLELQQEFGLPAGADAMTMRVDELEAQLAEYIGDE